MKNFKKMISLALVVVIMMNSVTPIYANSKSDTNVININEDFNKDEIIIDYKEHREDGEYYIVEKINGNKINSKIYKIEDGENVLKNSIISEIDNGKVFCLETKSDGIVEKYEVSAKIIDNIENHKQDKNEISLLGNNTYLRTDSYGISLVGRKVTIAIAAAAIVAAVAYINMAVATKIIISAISAGGGAGVASLPDYLYVTSNVYRTHSTGKIYTRYENDYYLDSERTQYIGSWSFSERGLH